MIARMQSWQVSSYRDPSAVCEHQQKEEEISIVSLFGGSVGGFLIGAILGIVGGTLALVIKV